MNRGGTCSARPDEKNLVPPKNGEAEKGQAAKDLAFRLKLSAGGSLFRVGTHRRRRRPRGHCFFFSAQAPKLKAPAKTVTIMIAFKILIRFSPLS